MYFLSRMAPVLRVVASLSPTVLILAAEVNAAGYSVQENSASYMATGFAGRASNPQDASIIANNPAGLGFVEDRQVLLGSALILEGGDFEGKYVVPEEPDESGKAKDFQSMTPVPFGHLVLPINDKLNFGVSGYGPFGIELDYDKNWPGRYFGEKTSVKVMNLQGTFSYKLNENFALGAGLIGSYVKGELTQKVNTKELSPLLGYPPGKVEGDDTTVGWNLGALWRVNDDTLIGAAYHSKLDFTLKGHSEINAEIQGKPINLKEDATLGIVMPERFAFSLTHQLNEQWTVMADATWTKWSRFKEFYVKAGVLLSSYVPMNWKDVWSFSLGTSYQLDSEWQLRAGYMLDESPVSDSNRTVRSPDSDRSWYTCGFNWKPNSTFNVDVSYAFVDLKKGKIREEKYNKPGSATDVDTKYGVITGEYSNSSHIIAAQLSYLF